MGAFTIYYSYSNALYISADRNIILKPKVHNNSERVVLLEGWW